MSKGAKIVITILVIIVGLALWVLIYGAPGVLGRGMKGLIVFFGVFGALNALWGKHDV